MEIEESVYDDENMMNSSTLKSKGHVNTSLNHSGLLRFTNEITTQTEWNNNLRKGSRNLKDSIKISLAASTTTANISPHQSKIAFKVASEKSLVHKTIFRLIILPLSRSVKQLVQQNNSKCIKMCCFP